MSDSEKSELNDMFPAVGGGLPDYAREDEGLGNENVDGGALATPRLKLMQPMSDVVTEGQDASARPGLIQNDVTGEFFESLYVINLYLDINYIAFKKRKFGQEFLGPFASREQAEAAVAENTAPDEQFDIYESHNHTVLVIDEKGEVKTPAVIQMKSTNAKVSRQWNSMIQTEGRGAARFALVWQINTKFVKGKNGPYYIYDVELAGATPEHLYVEAKSLYQSINGSAEAVA